MEWRTGLLFAGLENSNLFITFFCRFTAYVLKTDVFCAIKMWEVQAVLKIAICDDETVMCGQLKELVSGKLSQWQEDFTVVCYTNAMRLLFSPMDFNLIFLDVQMPGINGMSLARKLRQKGFEGVLIFVTVMREYMPEAFEVEAMDFLCKPIDPKRLEAALARSVRRLGTEAEDTLFIRTANWCRAVKIRDIYYCEVMDRKIYVHMKGDVIEYYGRMKDLEKQTAFKLIRCHRSYLINPRYLSEYRCGFALLENGEKIPVAQSCRQGFMEQMMRYMEKEG